MLTCHLNQGRRVGRVENGCIPRIDTAEKVRCLSCRSGGRLLKFSSFAVVSRIFHKKRCFACVHISVEYSFPKLIVFTVCVYS